MLRCGSKKVLLGTADNLTFQTLGRIGDSIAMARITIFGIGYVGAVSAACLAEDGHQVIAVDVSQARVDQINRGESPIVEAGLRELIASGVADGRLSATTDSAQAIADSDISLICVGTPSAPSGAIGTTYIAGVCQEIGTELARKVEFHSVIIRSTIVPGTMDDLCVPLLEASSGKTAGRDFGVGYYPEFLREGSAIKDYRDPGLIVFGTLDKPTADMLLEINAGMPVDCNVVSLRTAEAVKYANNAWRAIKITFANEIGNISKSCGIDGQAVMQLICQDTRVNISPAFMKPGFAFGGSCLPKDLRALRHLALENKVATPLIDAALTANKQQIDKAERLVEEAGAGRVGLVGLSFKPGTDDMRESPMAELAKRLVGKGYEVNCYDPNVSQAQFGRPGTQMDSAGLPGFGKQLVKSIDDLIQMSDIIVVGNHYEESVGPLGKATLSKRMIDLSRIDKGLRSNGLYEGICW